MQPDIPYGDGTLPLPARFKSAPFLHGKELPVPHFSSAELFEAFSLSLKKPVSGSPFRKCIVRGGRTCIIVSDKTRRYGAPSWLPWLLDECNAAGVPDELITVLFATGAHEGHSAVQRRETAGAEAAGRVRLVDHNCDARGDMVFLGVTRAGTPVHVNSLACRADNLITTGVVLPHYYAGFSGGRKSILPGVCSRKSIFTNHSLNLAPGGGSHPGAATMQLDGNPIHEDMIDALRFVDVTFSVNVIARHGDRPEAFFSGDICAAHLQACRAARGIMGLPIANRFDWVIASCGGSPKDINLYQSHKSLDNAFRAARPGGTIILAAHCGDGAGPPGFIDWFETGDREFIEAELRKEFSVMGHTALRTLEKTSACRVFLVSSLPDEIVRSTGMVPAGSIGEAVEKARISGDGGAVLSSASSTVPLPPD